MLEKISFKRKIVDVKKNIKLRDVVNNTLIELFGRELDLINDKNKKSNLEYKYTRKGNITIITPSSVIAQEIILQKNLIIDSINKILIKNKDKTTLVKDVKVKIKSLD
ncbi:MAG: hypothetical protein ACYDBX_00355 [Patescibacteria group bacterium]